MTTKQLEALVFCVITGWLLGVIILFLMATFTDGRVFDSTWLQLSS